MSTILVTGGTGTLGRAVVDQLGQAGHGVRVLSRRPPADPDSEVEWVTGDLRSGAGLDGAVRDVATILHCATDGRRPGNDLLGTRLLLEAVRAAGRPPLVYVSIVGVDRIPLPYYRVKLEVEQLVAASGLPWTILRATQFHNLVATVLRVVARPPVMVVPGDMSVQPVDVRDVAARLIELAPVPAAGRVPDFGGPQVQTFPELAQAYLRATGQRRRVLPVRLPGAIARAFRRGEHLAPDHADGRRTFEEFLAGG